VITLSNLNSYLNKYKRFLETPEGRKGLKERGKKIKLFKEIFSKENISHPDSFLEEKLKQILASLWAMEIWTRKEERVEKILKKNGLDNLCKHLCELLYGQGSIKTRLDKFLNSVWGLGISTATEIMCFTEPKLYALWNAKVAKALEKLELADQLNLPKTCLETPAQVRGSQYEIILHFLSNLKNKIGSMLGREIDYVELDYFFYYVAYLSEKIPTEEITEIEVSEIKTHEEAQYYLLELGKILGYATYVAKGDKGKEVYGKTLGEVADLADLPDYVKVYPHPNSEGIDIMWFNPNADALKYVFEVSHTSDMKKDLASLIGIIKIVYEKAFIVAPENRKDEYQRLIQTTPYRQYKNKLGFISYKELIELYQKAKNLKETADKIGITISP